MTDPRDQIDDWLEHGVTPLYPPTDALDRIRRRARQRKTRQATFAAAGCAVVLAGALVTPQLLATGQHSHHAQPTIAAGPSSPEVQPSPSQSSPTAAPDGKATQIKQHTTLTKSWTDPPGHFRPTSVTFVGTGTGPVIGAVIGQAGIPGKCATSVCTSLAGTKDYGQSWYGVGAPVAPGPTSSAGVSQLRFASTSDGWAYGPAMYETTRGGWPWKPENTYDENVIDVEAVRTRAFAVFGSCTGTGADYAANCTSYSLWTSVAGSKTWTTVDVPSAYRQMPSASSASSAAPQLIISGGTTAYLLTPSGQVLSGPTSGGSWHLVGKAPCSPGPGGASGQASQSPAVPASGTQSSSAAPSSGTQSSSAAPGSGTQGSASPGYGAEFATGPQLLLTCQSQAAAAQVTMYTSTNGARWHRAGSLTVSGNPTSLTSAASGQAVLATTDGIEYSANGGRTWRAAKFAGAGAGKTGPAGGFSYVGMTNPTQGVAVPADSKLGSVYVTSDGGKSWHQSPITG
ncbi:MAG TPA: hypothetical protein VKB62_09530 [Streptosporangiaceae bacterium]|nr:hypothetical protein [Streptosporangiaceae bacterium]